MAHELANDGEAAGLSVALDRRRDVAEPAARLSVLNGYLQAFLSHPDQAFRLAADLAHRHCAAHVRPEAIQDQPQVQADDISLGYPAASRDPVHRLVVDRDANRVREAVVAEEARSGTGGPHAAFGQAVELDRPHPRPDRLLQLLYHALQDLSRACHELDFVARFQIYHLFSRAGLAVASRALPLTSLIS